ncbi:hypothetical protein [Streptomyces sp. NPDC090053]|uniref:hypothetical protein n=1 Tax=Streptomyces sp. NPDC090053 TaxID=3365932 RepID=UPI00382F7551
MTLRPPTALRLPAARTAATAWLAALAEDTTSDPDVRPAALVHRTRCVPETIGDTTVPTVIDLLHQLTPAPQTKTEEKARRTCSGARTCAPAAETASQGTSPQLAAAFADMERPNRLHAPTTSAATRGPGKWVWYRWVTAPRQAQPHGERC